jgi:hypothetical protein
MGVLAEYVKDKADSLLDESSKVEAATREWQDAIGALYAQLRGWIEQADGGTGLLRAKPRAGDILHETRLGVYSLDQIVISLGGRASVVAPRARYVVATIKPPGQEPRAADGIVEIRSGAGAAEYYLFRAAGSTPAGDRWYIQSDARWHGDPLNNDVEELTSDRFEQAVLSILR